MLINKLTMGIKILNAHFLFFFNSLTFTMGVRGGREGTISCCRQLKQRRSLVAKRGGHHLVVLVVNAGDGCVATPFIVGAMVSYGSCAWVS
jgi:hypothetical protein